MSISTSRDLRCPQCGAQCPPAVDWCTLCFASLREEPPAPPAVVAADESPAEPSEPAAVPVPAPGPSRRGKHAKPDPSDAAGARALIGGRVDEALADEMLAQLAAADDGALTRVGGLVGSRGRKLGVVLLGSLAATSLLVLVMFLLGSMA